MPADLSQTPALLLVLVVAVVGVLHTLVPDHWVPITLLARQRGWSRGETARAALQAGAGHVVTTLIIGLVVWFAGVAFATRFGTLASELASAALVLFGAWIAVGAWRELRRDGGHGHRHGGPFGHSHAHAGHEHRHGPARQRIDTGHGMAELSIFEDGVPPRFRFTGPAADGVRAETVRPDGGRQVFAFARRGGYWESLDEIPEPHGFEVLLTLGHGQHDHVLRTRFFEHAHGAHGHDLGHDLVKVRGHDHGHRHGEHGADEALHAPLGGVAVLRHAHVHRHGGTVHVHWHDHAAETAHAVGPDIAASPPAHVHGHETSSRTALLLILGSSPMVEGIPAFFAAGRYGIGEIVVMAVVFALATIATYVAVCVASTMGLQRVRLGPLERYGEVVSGLFIALVGVVFWFFPVA